MNKIEKLELKAEEGLEELIGLPKKPFYKKAFFWLLFLFLIIIIGLSSIYFIYWQPLKNSVVLASQAQSYFEKAQSDLLVTNFPEAKKDIEKAQNLLDQLEKNIAKLNSPLLIGYLKTQYQGVTTIVNSVQEFSKGLYLLTNLAHDTFLTMSQDKNGQPAFSAPQRIEILGNLVKKAPDLNGAKAQIELSLITLNQIQPQKLNSSLAQYYYSLQNKLTLLKNFLGQAVSLSETLPKILGLGQEKTYLFLLQNSDELRPSGGFIGTVGILKLKNGQITSFKTNDVYDYDRFAINKKMKVEPPAPIAKYLNVKSWYLRDSNWSPDFSEAAKKIEWFYHEESSKSDGSLPNEKIDGVIAITPQLIEDLMETLGAVEVDSFVFNKENFVDQLQYLVEINIEERGVPYFARKNIIGDIAQKLITRLDNLSLSGWLDIFKKLFNNLNQKNILVYLKDPSIQNLVTEQNWSGVLKQTSNDYLMVVDANLASLKSNQCVQRNVQYTITPENSRLKAKTEITYTNSCSFTWKSTRYRTYTRIYVPLGSKWIKTDGSMDMDRSPKKGFTDIMEENNKTVFGTFIAIEPGQKGTLSFEYYLPDSLTQKITDQKTYSLYLQKQPGIENNLSVDLNLGQKIINSEPSSSKSLIPSHYQLSGTLATDKEINLEF